MKNKMYFPMLFLVLIHLKLNAFVSKPIEKIVITSMRCKTASRYGLNFLDTLPLSDNHNAYKKAIPQKVIAYIKKEIPLWHFPSPNLWDSKTFNEHLADNSLVNFLTSDLNGDSKIDYTILLVNNKNEVALWVLLGLRKGFKKIPIETFESLNGQFRIIVLEGLRPGLYKFVANDLPDPKPILIKNNSIKLVFKDDITEAVYWDENRFKSFYIKDLL